MVKSSSATQVKNPISRKEGTLVGDLRESFVYLFNLKRRTRQTHIFAYRPFESSSLILAAFPGLARDLCACIKGRSGARAVTRHNS